MVNLYSTEAKNSKWIITQKSISESERLRFKESVLFINLQLDPCSFWYLPQ